MTEIDNNIFNGITAFFKIGDYSLIPLKIQFGGKRLIISIEPEKEEMGEKEAIELIESLHKQLEKDEIPHAIFTRNINDNERIDAVSIDLKL